MQPRKPITILMADDDPDDRQLTQEAFEESRLANDLRFVEDGEELLDYLNRRGKYADPAQAPRPGLILLDLNMPRKDGREALQEIKADPDLRRIRVVVMTTSKAEEDIFRTYDLRRDFVHHQAGDVRAAGRGHPDARQVLARDRRAALLTPGGEMDRVRVLLVDDDEDDYLLTRDLLAEIMAAAGTRSTGRRTTTPGSRCWRAAATTSTCSTTGSARGPGSSCCARPARTGTRPR